MRRIIAPYHQLAYARGIDILKATGLNVRILRVPDGKVFVLSDDRNYGEDSRNKRIGCLDVDSILGVVRVRIRDFAIFTREP